VTEVLTESYTRSSNGGLFTTLG